MFKKSSLRSRVMEIVEARLRVAEEAHEKRVETYKADYLEQLELVHQNFNENKKKSEDLAVEQSFIIK